MTTSDTEFITVIRSGKSYHWTANGRYGTQSSVASSEREAWTHARRALTAFNTPFVVKGKFVERVVQEVGFIDLLEETKEEPQAPPPPSEG